MPLCSKDIFPLAVYINSLLVFALFNNNNTNVYCIFHIFIYEHKNKDYETVLLFNRVYCTDYNK